MPDPRIAVFFGAGASCAEGAPTQAKLFNAYFKFNRIDKDREGKRTSVNTELAKFFQTFFDIDVNHDNLNRIVFPTFEEALGTLELAISREESFLGLDNPILLGQGSRIRSVRQALILLIAIILDHTLEHSKDLHKRLIARLVEMEIVKNFEFLSLNYDILIDNALVARHDIVDLDYCLEFTNFEKKGGPGQWHRPDPKKAVRLLKLHGSLNWLYCPTCRAIRLASRREQARGGILDSYRHLREHGNSFFIVSLEIVLGFALFAAGLYESKGFRSEDRFILYLAILFVWIFPSVLVWFIATNFEREFSEAPLKDTRSTPIA